MLRGVDRGFKSQSPLSFSKFMTKLHKHFTMSFTVKVNIVKPERTCEFNSNMKLSAHTALKPSHSERSSVQWDVYRLRMMMKPPKFSYIYFQRSYASYSAGWRWNVLFNLTPKNLASWPSSRCCISTNPKPAGGSTSITTPRRIDKLYGSPPSYGRRVTTLQQHSGSKVQGLCLFCSWFSCDREI